MIAEFILTLIVMNTSFFNLWNLIDFFMIVAIIGLWIADVCVSDFYASAVFKIRALFRMYKVSIHILYMMSPPFVVKLKQKVGKKASSKGEEVAEILEGMKRRSKRNSIISVD